MAPSPPSHTNRMATRGMTLMEVMVALFILSIGILGVAQLQMTAIRGNSSANHISVAAMVAADQAETLLDMGFHDANLKDGTTTEGPYQIQWKLSPWPDASSSSRDIDLTISWNTDGRPHALNYKFIKAHGI